MANTVFKLRRSSVAGKKPTTSDIAIGELAINLTDRKLFSSDGSNIWEVASNLESLSVSGNTSANNILFSGGIYTNGSFGSAGQVLFSNGSAIYWDSAAAASVNVSASYTWTNTHTFNNTVYLNAVSANGSLGSDGQVLSSNGSSTYWKTVTSGGGGAPSMVVVTGTSQTGVKDNRYVLTNTSPTTLTLPSTPSAGDTLYVVVSNGLANNVVARNGSNIMSTAEDMTLDIINMSIGLMYVNSTLGWVII